VRTSVDWVLDFRQAPIGRACTVPFLGIHFREHRESSPTTRQNLAVFHQRPFRGESYEDDIDYDQSTEGMHWDRNRANYYYQGITEGGALVSVSGIRQELLSRLRGNEPHAGGVGLSGMRERVRELGGELNIESSRRGTTLIVMIPVATELQRTESATLLPEALVITAGVLGSGSVRLTVAAFNDPNFRRGEASVLQLPYCTIDQVNKSKDANFRRGPLYGFSASRSIALMACSMR
jgi:hypothetical protein